MDWFSGFAEYRPPRLPKECSCGNTSSKNWCTGTGLCNHIHFPPFAYLPEENNIDEHFYGPDDDSGCMYSPIRHWALVGEIVETSFWLRPRVTIETRFGERVLVNFHLEGATKPTFFDWTALKTHSQVCVVILYAVNRTFMDMNQGVRQENPDSIMVFPASLSELTKEVDGYAQAHRHKNEYGGPICFHCSKPETGECKLARCNRCKKATYCGRDCQIPHWKGSHKKLCRHATMLSDLSALDFSVFHNYMDWKLEVQDPPTKQEKQERSRRAMRMALYEAGALAPELRPRTSRLSTLLSAIQDKSLATDPHIQKYQESTMMMMTRDDPDAAIALSSAVNETFLYQSMRTFADALQEDPQLRHHVVDLRLQQAHGGFGRSTWSQHFIAEEILDSLFWVLPIWQHEEGIGKLSWSFESHALFTRCRSLYESIDGYAWNVVGDHDSVVVKNRVSGNCMFATDNLEIVGEIGEALATERPDEMVIRVLRATANESGHGSIQRIVTKRDVPDNLYTLWIREDLAECGRFNPPKEQSLLRQLTDTESFDPTEGMLREWGVLPQKILRRREEAFEVNVGEPVNNTAAIKCASCSLCKAKSAFSKTQLKAKGALARCKDCIEQSQY